MQDRLCKERTASAGEQSWKNLIQSCANGLWLS